MYKANRDLWLLSKNKTDNHIHIQQEIEKLNQLLYTVEHMKAFCSAHEIIDLNKYKIIRKPHLMEQAVANRQLQKPFVFLHNKN